MERARHLATTLAEIFDGDPWYASALNPVLADISAVTAAARPLELAHSIWEITLHIDAWNRVCLRRLAGEAVAEPPEDFPGPETITPDAWRQSRVQLSESCRELIAKAGRFTEAELAKTVAGKTYTVDFLIEGAGQHWIYHAGQIALLRRAMG